MRMIRVLAIIGVVITSPILAQETSPEFTAALKAEALKTFDSLEATADHEMYRCQLAGRIIFLGISLRMQTTPNVNWDCIQIGKSSISTKYTEIKAKVAADKDALSALNDYAASLLAVFDDLRPRDQERER